MAISLDGIRNDGADPDGNGSSSAAEENDLVDSTVESAIGGQGNDHITGSDAVNLIKGGNGDDVMDGLLGADILDGANGIDTITYANRSSASPIAVTLDGSRNDGLDLDGDGVSTVAEEGDSDRRVENVIGGAGNDRFTALIRVGNILIGGDGDDVFFARDKTGPADQLNCGNGTDSTQSDTQDARNSCESTIP